MIIAIEGAPGVGKSTTASALMSKGWCVVPEVNRLFPRPVPEPRHWYHARQVARWEMARLRSSRGESAALDGDPYQPLWFAWIYQNDGWPQDAAAFDFYRSRIAASRMGFPELYVFMHVAEPERRDRMISRELSLGRSLESARRKTDRYALMVEPQRRFFDALSKRFKGWVLDVETLSIERSVAAIGGALPRAPAIDGLEALDFIERWLAANAGARSYRVGKAKRGGCGARVTVGRDGSPRSGYDTVRGSSPPSAWGDRYVFEGEAITKAG